MFKKLFVLFSLLTLCVPLCSCATHIKYVKTGDIQALSIIQQAHLDAEGNISPMWNNINAILPFGFMMVGAMTGDSVESLIGTPNPMYILAGATIGCLTPLSLVSTYKPTPNPKAFIGKSPEYILIYTDAYRQKTKELRRKPIIIGTIGAPLVPLLLISFR